MTNEEREIIEYVADIPLPVVKNTITVFISKDIIMKARKLLKEEN